MTKNNRSSVIRVNVMYSVYIIILYIYMCVCVYACIFVHACACARKHMCVYVFRLNYSKCMYVHEGKSIVSYLHVHIRVYILYIENNLLQLSRIKNVLCCSSVYEPYCRYYHNYYYRVISKYSTGGTGPN